MIEIATDTIEVWQQVIQTQNMEIAIVLVPPDVSKAEIETNKTILVEHDSQYASTDPRITTNSSTQYQDCAVIRATRTLNPASPNPTHLVEMQY